MERLTIQYDPHEATYRVTNGGTDKIVLPAQIAPGGSWSPLEPIFRQAREAALAGRAIAGVFVDV